MSGAVWMSPSVAVILPELKRAWHEAFSPSPKALLRRFLIRWIRGEL